MPCSVWHKRPPAQIVLMASQPTRAALSLKRANLWEHVRSLRRHGTTVLLTTITSRRPRFSVPALMIMDHSERRLLLESPHARDTR
jgi:hypothetical protein